MRTCERCEAQFSVAGRRKEVAKYCSRTCRDAALVKYEDPRTSYQIQNRRRRANRRLTFDGVGDEEIFRRDGYKCLIPGCLSPNRPVTRPFSTSDPWAGVIDHILPISRGGQDTSDNKRAAHQRCNGVKGARLDQELAIYREVQEERRSTAA